MRAFRLFPIVLALIVAVNVFAGWESRAAGPGYWGISAWVATILLLILCFALVGWLPSGTPPVSDWRGVLIDQRNKISLSRFQLVLWSLLVISAIITEGTVNALMGSCNPLGLGIPNELWILLGLSGGTAVAAPVVLAAKNTAGTLQTNEANQHAWADMFYGDEIGNFDQVDFSKVQQFFLTVVVVLVYAIEIGYILLDPEICGATCAVEATTAVGVTADNICNAVAALHFPALSPGILAIIAVSQVAYIAYKAAPQTKLDAQPPAANDGGGGVPPAGGGTGPRPPGGAGEAKPGGAQ